MPLGSVIFIIVLILPIMDEIVGGWQFRSLCKENTIINVDRSTAVGKTVYLAKSSSINVENSWVNIVYEPRIFVDIKTNESIISFNDLIADGGLLVHMVDFWEGRTPMIFDASCVPINNQDLEILFKQLNIKVVPRPELNNGELK
ncbi:hypothetical protein AB835_11240 [Candidatus Endobugula sertula]|uniref:Uncharacterized protein n=1 Tax=Candidatus Endobugula sertula TaxID=62101 RepID=A0A1D2QN32_9GAMM|nr:hypothetical protein AB835_11240 [Candidatus Endobugula sertula]